MISRPFPTLHVLQEPFRPTPTDPFQRLVRGQALRIHPAFQLGAGGGLDHVWRIYTEVETEYECGGKRLETGTETPWWGCRVVPMTTNHIQ